MLRARIVVSEKTDVAAELDKLERLARRERLDDVTAFAMIREVELVLADLKRHGVESAAYGIGDRRWTTKSTRWSKGF